ncbi:hypothetical protein ASE74_00510 [Pedobacter sp. Leaf216]|uniref:hypothetical protein n=1 Tax=Pedobacter sp. Leaf216 TaxID=1735684 RepID=UPI0006FDCD30|nr:hypothetical protein [Pedobacter sp. Leaf216]KQM79096.1 hypothetical protein ASE74_00510 [Pedobacter sp. Leaf216]
METDLIISAINEIHQKANQALENKDVTNYAAIFSEDLTYTPAEGVTLNKRDYTIDLKKYFNQIKEIHTSYYRIKSSFENEIFTEKIARKSVVLKPNLLIFSKKQTVQTEEIYHWKKIKAEWKVVAIEIVLEEKY